MCQIIYISSNLNGWCEQDDLPIVWSCVIQVVETGEPKLWHFVLTFVACCCKVGKLKEKPEVNWCTRCEDCGTHFLNSQLIECNMSMQIHSLCDSISLDTFDIFVNLILVDLPEDFIQSFREPTSLERLATAAVAFQLSMEGANPQWLHTWIATLEFL